MAEKKEAEVFGKPDRIHELLKAQRFQPAKEVPLSTHARSPIRQASRRFPLRCELVHRCSDPFQRNVSTERPFSGSLYLSIINLSLVVQYRAAPRVEQRSRNLHNLAATIHGAYRASRYPCACGIRAAKISES
jgi:hypothetical protein